MGQLVHPHPRKQGDTLNIASCHSFEHPWFLQELVLYSALYCCLICSIVFSHFVDQFSHCVIYTSQIVQLEEKDTQTKLEILFKKNLYPMAIRLLLFAVNTCV